jgi:hypothetical protein
MTGGAPVISTVVPEVIVLCRAKTPVAPTITGSHAEVPELYFLRIAIMPPRMFQKY